MSSKIITTTEEGNKILKQQQQPLAILQDDFTPSKGNALQACVASIFGQPLHEVPNFITMDCGYLQGIQDYVKDSYTVHKKNASNGSIEDVDDIGKLCILRGKSPRGDFGHVVVARIKEDKSIEMKHDPHPDGTYLDMQETYGWYIVFEGKGDIS